MSTTPVATSDQGVLLDATVDAIIRKYTVYSMAAGLVPVPLLDIAAVTATQLKMLGEISAACERDFDEERVRSVIGSLLATVSGLSIGRGVIGSIVKAIPVVGTIGGMAIVPIMSGASTFALGRVFSAHFQSGGTLLTFDAGKMKDEFKRQLQVGKGVAESLKTEAVALVKKDPAPKDESKS